MVAAGIQTHILITQPLEHKSDAPDHSAMTHHGSRIAAAGVWVAWWGLGSLMG